MWVTWPVYFLLTVFKILWAIIVWFVQIEIAIFRFIIQGIIFIYISAYEKSPIGVIATWISLGCEVILFALLEMELISDNVFTVISNIYTFGTGESYSEVVNKVLGEYLPMIFLSKYAIFIAFGIVIFIPIVLTLALLILTAYPIIHGLAVSLIYKIASLFMPGESEPKTSMECAEQHVKEDE